MQQDLLTFVKQVHILHLEAIFEEGDKNIIKRWLKPFLKDPSCDV